MAYILNRTNGTVLAKLEDGSIDRSTDLIFVGKNYAGYGEIINEDLLKLLENFSNKTAPSKPISGQLWYDSANKRMNVYNGATFNKFPAVEYSATAPTTLTNIGDMWFNTSEKKLYIKSSASTGAAGFTLIGPSTSNTAAAVMLATVTDQDQNTRYVLKHVINGVTSAVSSTDEFTLASTDSLYGAFTYIRKGITLSGANASTGNSADSGYYLWGTAATANRLGNYVPSDFLLKSDYNSGIANGFTIDNDNGVLVGTNGVFRFHANAGAREGKITAVQGTSISFSLRYPSVTDSVKKVLVIDGNKLVPAEVAFDLGTNGNRFNSLYSSNGDITNFSAYNATFTGNITAPTKGTTDYSNAVATTAFVRNAIPAGIITMWYGAANQVPAGWAICNGQNGTPDLRDRFIVGAGSSYTNGNTGGSKDAIVPTHSHLFTAWGSTTTTGGHVHLFPGDDQLQTLAGQAGWPGNVTANGLQYDAKSTLYDTSSYGRMYTTSYSGDHYHDVTINGSTANQGSSGTNANLPPYYALYYIMKL